MIRSMGESELELGVPDSETVEDGEWVLAIFDLGNGHRATSASARASIAPEGPRLIFEPRDWHKLADFAQTEASRTPSQPSMENPLRETEPAASLPHTTRSAGAAARSGTGA